MWDASLMMVHAILIMAPLHLPELGTPSPHARRLVRDAASCVCSMEVSASAKTLTTLHPSMQKCPIQSALWSVRHAAVLPIHAVELCAMLCTRSQVVQPWTVAHPTTATVATPAIAGMLVT